MCVRLISKAGCSAVKFSTGSASRRPLSSDFKIIRENIFGKTSIMATGPGNFWTIEIVSAFLIYGAAVISSSKANKVVDGMDAFEEMYRNLEII